MKFEVLLLLYSAFLLPITCYYAKWVTQLIHVPDPSYSNKFNKPLESLRGIAAFAVLMAHTTMYFYGDGRGAGFKTSSFLGQGGVVWFFMLTGYLFWSMALQDRLSLSTFYQKRVHRLVPAMFAMIGIVTLFEWIVTGLPMPSYDQLLSILKNFLFGFAGVNNVFLGESVQRINNIWTLRWEWLFYLALPLVISITRSWLGLIVIFFILSLTMTDISNIWRGETDAALLLSFFMGMSIAAFQKMITTNFNGFEKVSKVTSGYVALLFALAVACSSLLLPDNMIRSRNIIFVVLNTPLFFWFFIQFYSDNTRITKLVTNPNLLILGRISYSLYLWHLAISYFVHKLFARNILPGNDEILQVITMPYIVILLSVPIAVYSYKYIELPFMYLNNKPIGKTK